MSRLSSLPLPALFVLSALALCGCGERLPIELASSQRGVATYYAATGDGACSFGPSPEDLNVAALNAEQYTHAAYCGACVEVHGPRGRTKVRIVDLCPECERGQLDLSEEAFAQIASLEQGRVEIEWELSTCEVEGPIRYHFKEGSSIYWTALQVQNHRLPVKSLEWRREGKWLTFERQDFNYFVAEKGVGEGPLELRLTALDDEVLYDTFPSVRENAVLQGDGQFTGELPSHSEP